MRRLAAVLLVAVAVASALGGCSKKKHNSAVSTTTTSAPPATTTTAGSAKAFVPAIPGGTTNTTVINCQPVPARSTVPAPDGLPSLPAGSRWFEASDQSGVKVYASAAPESLPQLQSRAVKTWKAEG
ncbi:MAG TPA: hypothetical protein VGO92_10435, partial [Acidimicrobiales bacterium]|nr:hypothetical protein [Acidimicrobiales bacterium]